VSRKRYWALTWTDQNGLPAGLVVDVYPEEKIRHGADYRSRGYTILGESGNARAAHKHLLNVVKARIAKFRTEMESL
jgi:hypothetical protein